MVGRVTSGILALIVLSLASCSVVPSPFKGVWTAQPEFREVDNALCSVRIAPQKGNHAYYAFFLLTIVNRSDDELILDYRCEKNDWRMQCLRALLKTLDQAPRRIRS
jgi:hypothetical protein